VNVECRSVTTANSSTKLEISYRIHSVDSSCLRRRWIAVAAAAVVTHIRADRWWVSGVIEHLSVAQLLLQQSDKTVTVQLTVAATVRLLNQPVNSDAATSTFKIYEPENRCCSYALF